MSQPIITAAEARALLDALAAANELQCARSNPCPACVARRAAAAALTDAAAGLAASVIAHAAAAREYLDAEKRELTHNDLAAWRASNAARAALAAMV
jgi:hypothetical protein